MANMNIQNYGSDNLIHFDDCEFESNVVTFAAAGSVKKGDILARAADGTFKLHDGSTTTPVAVYIDEDASLADAGTIPCRALIAGKVRKDKILVGGSTADIADLDGLKAAGIIPVAFTEMNITDNQ